MTHRLDPHIQELPPGYFAMVMATGIVSLGAHLLGFRFIANLLFATNVLIFVVLTVGTAQRLLLWPRRMLADLADYTRGPGFFTLVAGTCILGKEFLLIANAPRMAGALLVVGAVLWVVIIYSFFVAITTTNHKKSLEQGINGSWLLIIVATQAVSVLTTSVAAAAPAPSPVMLFMALCLYLVGALLYIYLMSLIIYRLSFFALRPDELGAPYWINMGATAITTLAGASLLLNSGHTPLLTELRPFLKGFTLFFWAAGTWWIPLLVPLGIWRHFIRKVPLPTLAEGYNPSYWGMVFPLGMYTVCTYRLAQALGTDFLYPIPAVFIYVAFFAWAAVMKGFVMHTRREFFAPAPQAEAPVQET